MINADVLHLAERAAELAGDVNRMKPPPGVDLQQWGRAMAIARTNLQTAELWLKAAASEDF